MKNLFMQNWPTILIIGAFLFWILSLVINKKWDELRAAGYKLIMHAERTITGTKRGKERFEFVIGRLYTLIPGWLQFFVTEESLREKLQEWYDSIKDYLDDGQLNQSK